MNLIDAGNLMMLVEHGLGVDHAKVISDQWRAKCAEVEKLRTALEPFAARADIKGGTAAADKFKAFIVYMMEVNKPGDGVDIIYQFTTACLNARAALMDDNRTKP